MNRLHSAEDAEPGRCAGAQLGCAPIIPRTEHAMLTYNLQLVVLQDAWEHNASGVAYCYEQAPLDIYDPELFQWIALVDVLNPALWGRAAAICYGVAAGEPLRLPRLTDDDATPRVVIRYDPLSRRYLVYPETQPAAARAKVRLEDALAWARDVAAEVAEARPVIGRIAYSDGTAIYIRRDDGLWHRYSADGSDGVTMLVPFYDRARRLGIAHQIARSPRGGWRVEVEDDNRLYWVEV